MQKPKTMSQLGLLQQTNTVESFNQSKGIGWCWIKLSEQHGAQSIYLVTHLFDP